MDPNRDAVPRPRENSSDLQSIYRVRFAAGRVDFALSCDEHQSSSTDEELLVREQDGNLEMWIVGGRSPSSIGGSIPPLRDRGRTGECRACSGWRA